MQLILFAKMIDQYEQTTTSLVFLWSLEGSLCHDLTWEEQMITKYGKAREISGIQYPSSFTAFLGINKSLLHDHISFLRVLLSVCDPLSYRIHHTKASKHTQTNQYIQQQALSISFNPSYRSLFPRIESPQYCRNFWQSKPNDHNIIIKNQKSWHQIQDI